MASNLFDDATRARLIRFGWLTPAGELTKWGERALRDAKLDGFKLRALAQAKDAANA